MKDMYRDGTVARRRLKAAAFGTAVWLASLTVSLPSRGVAQESADLVSYLAVESIVVDDAAVNAPGDTRVYVPLTVHMRNIGSKAITAYRLKVEVVHPDGKTDSTVWTEDSAPTIAAMATPGVLPIPNCTLNPGPSESGQRRWR